MSRKGAAAIAKKIRITTAPTSDPISGRLSSRAPTDREVTRSSTPAGVVMVDAMAATSAGSGRGVLRDSLDVRLVDERRTGEGRLAAADRVAVGLVQPDRVDGQVALQVRLLVDGEVDRAVLDRLGH